MKYHPEESMKRKEEQLGFLRNRKDTFVYLLDNNYITSVSVDTTQNDALLKLLDITVINLEGGNEDDIKCLDEKEKQIEHSSISSIKSQHLLSTSSTTSTATAAAAAAVATFGKNEEDVIIVNSAPISSEKNWDDEITAVDKGKNVTDGDNWDDDELTEDKKDDIARKQIDEEIHNDKNQIIVKHKMDKKKFKKIRKKTNSESSNSSSSSSDSSDDDEDDDAEDNNIGADKATFNEYNKELDKNVENDINNINNNEKVKIYEIDGGVDEKLINNNDDQKTDDIQKDKVIESGDITGGDDGKTEQLNAEKPDADKAETIDLIQDIDTSMDKVMPRALHRTSSIFLRNLAPTITKSEVEAMCKRYSGFLRVAIADPLVDRRWFRRGWVTFIRDVNIKEICWNLNNIRLRDCELGAIVNRDLSRRIRPVNGITAHKTIVRNDIKLCARIAHNLDTKAGLWLRADDVIVTSENGTKTNNINMNVNRGDDQQSFGLHSNNPVLQNITDYLIEEASAEEDELLGLSVIESKDSEGEFLERDIDLIRVLDKLILYLRIVHSVDFYNHCEYPYEDEMPNRCGIIHARGPPPQNKVTPNEIQDYIRNFETKISSFLVKSQSIDESELKKIGCKDIDAELEKFVQVNTQELGKDKWLCPLSGKKFKGPEFIRKHIFNKHAEKVDEVKKEVEYFNAYLKDPKRPQLPENPGNIRKAPTNTDMQTPQTGYRPFPGPGYMQHYAGYAPPMIVPPRPRGGFGGRRGVNSEYRPIIHYRDLDAPREPDDFL